MCKMKVRVYYEDTDLGGVVYYANYLRFMERGRSEFFREKGVNLIDWQNDGLGFVVSDVHIQFRSPARFDDFLDVETTLSEIRKASLTFDTKILNQHGTLLITSVTKVGCMNGRGRATRIPAEIIEKLGGA